MPIFTTLEEALTAQPTKRRSLFDCTVLTRTTSSTSLHCSKQQYRKATMPVYMPRPVINRNFCGGSGSVHALSLLLEGKESKCGEVFEVDELVPADDAENGGRKVRVDEKMEGEEGRKKNGGLKGGVDVV